MTRFIWSLVLVLTLVLALILGIAALAHHFISKYEGRQVNTSISTNLDSLDQILFIHGNVEDSVFISSLRLELLAIDEKNYPTRASTFGRRLSKYIDKSFEPVWIHILERQGQSAIDDLKITSRLVEVYERFLLSDPAQSKEAITCGEEAIIWPSATKIEQAEDCYFQLRSLKRELDFANFSNLMILSKNE